MEGKKERLRQGRPVELKPGLNGRLNTKDQTLELSDGRVLPISDANKRDLFPQNEQALKLAKTKEGLESDIANTTGGEFFHQLGESSAIGGIKDWGERFLLNKEEYQTRKQARNEISNRISEESPFTSGAATAASFVPDIIATRGMSALKAAPLLTGISAGSRVLDEPFQVAGETALAAAGGGLIDKASAFLGKIAARRGASRALPGQKQAVQEANALGRASTAQANLDQKEAHNILLQRAKNENAARLHQHNLEMTSRQNQIIKEQNEYAQKKLQRDAEVIRLKNKAEMDKAQRNASAAQSDAEYKAAKEAADLENKRMTEKFKLDHAQYEAQMKELPQLQKQAQLEHSQNVIKTAGEIEKTFPKQSRIDSSDLGLAEFIENSINQTGLAASREGSQAKRVLNSLFPEGELIGGRELSKKYKALEESIQRATPEVQSILNNFKNHLGERLPLIVEDSVAYHKIMPLLNRTIRGDVQAVVKELGLSPKNQATVGRFLETSLASTVKHDITPKNFIKKIQNGDLAREIAASIGDAEAFLVDMNLTPQNMKFLQKQGTLPILMKEAERQHAFFLSEIEHRIQSRLARYELKATESARNASKKLGKDVENTFGLAEPVQPPVAPTAPSPVGYPPAPGELPPLAPTQLPPPVAPPQAPPMPNRPGLMAEPTAPIPQSFTPQAEPMLSPAQGAAEGIGDFFEKDLLGGKGVINNPLTKLAGLKYLLGKAAIPAEAAYLGMKGLTSPTAGGAAARASFKQGGIQAIEMWAQKYPSYHNGILDNPQERRSLTKEIEDDLEIPIEQKAVLQSKVNRGKPLQARL